MKTVENRMYVDGGNKVKSTSSDRIYSRPTGEIFICKVCNKTMDLAHESEVSLDVCKNCAKV